MLLDLSKMAINSKGRQATASRVCDNHLGVCWNCRRRSSSSSSSRKMAASPEVEIMGCVVKIRCHGNLGRSA